jgi:hypothetical protein
MREDDHFLTWLRLNEGKGTVEELTEVYREHIPVLMWQHAGLANLLGLLCDFFYNNPTGVVHESFGQYEMSRWVKFHFPTTSQTGLKNVYKPNFVINDHYMERVHPILKSLISPSDELRAVLNEYTHLIDGVQVGMHIRRGWLAEDCRTNGCCHPGLGYADDEAIDTFKKIYDQVGGEVYLASDSPSLKAEFPLARKLETEIAGHTIETTFTEESRRNVFIDFFLLSMCPKLVVTGGNFPELPGISSFGYMAAHYGGAPFRFVINSQ